MYIIYGVRFSIVNAVSLSQIFYLIQLHDDYRFNPVAI